MESWNGGEGGRACRGSLQHGLRNLGKGQISFILPIKLSLIFSIIIVVSEIRESMSLSIRKVGRLR